MIRIIDIALKDFLQLTRDFKTFMFLLLMPVLFTLLFGFAFGGFGGLDGRGDARLPVGYLDEDGSTISSELVKILEDSEVIRLERYAMLDRASLEVMVADGQLAAAMVIPPGYGYGMLHSRREKLVLIGDMNSTAGMSVESEVLTGIVRLESAANTAVIFEGLVGEQARFDYIFDEALGRWQDPPIRVDETTSSAIAQQDDKLELLAHFSPGMMLQFAIAGLLTSAQIIINERKNRSLQRLLTTATRRIHILSGHWVAIFVLLLIQFALLILFAQVFLKINYLRDPAATLLVMLASVFCISALGLLIGMLARSEEQGVMLSLVPMFVFAGMGGVWVPLEITGPTFQKIGHLSPLAWAMDGFKNISIRGFGIEAVLIPALVLVGYGLLFFILAGWRMKAE
jgi:ABC-2 type transport system permease protein